MFTVMFLVFSVKSMFWIGCRPELMAQSEELYGSLQRDVCERKYRVKLLALKSRSVLVPPHIRSEFWVPYNLHTLHPRVQISVNKGIPFGAQFGQTEMCAEKPKV